MSPAVEFVQRTPEEIENTRSASRGRVSYPIIKGFLETGYQIAEVKITDKKRKIGTLAMLLRSYVDRHDYPISVVNRSSKLFLLRLDIDEEGKSIPDWQEKLADEKIESLGLKKKITLDEVEKHSG